MENTTFYSPGIFIPLLPTEQQGLILRLFGKKLLTDLNIEKEITKKILPLNGVFSKSLTYSEILIKCATHLKISTTHKSPKNIEEDIFKFQFNNAFEKLSIEEKEQFHNELLKISEQKGIDPTQAKTLTAIGSLAAANVSGFGLYVMASTVVGGLSSIIGVTLPFAFYTSMSSILSVITGPIGWTIGLSVLAYSVRNESLESIKKKLTASLQNSKSILFSDYDFAVAIITYLAANRLMIAEQISNDIHFSKEELSNHKNENEIIKKRNEVIHDQINKLKTEFNSNNSKLEENEKLIFKKQIHIKLQEGKLEKLI